MSARCISYGEFGLLVVIDNYDSFTGNLVHYFEMLDVPLRVIRNDRISLAELESLAPERIVISPGPGRPAEAGISCEVIRQFAGRIPILGVCLGHQCIAEVYGGSIETCDVPVHGKTSLVHHDSSGIFAGLPTPFSAGRYHSLTICPTSLPECLEVTARTEDGMIMGIRHKTLAIIGVQFHPESILTEHGLAMLRNYLAIEGGRW